MKKHEPNAVLLALEAASADEECAIVFFEKARWGAVPKCPHCASEDVYQQMDESGTKRERAFRWRCRKCKEKYSVRTGSIFEETRLPMKVWAHAMWRVCASKKGVSALQIRRETQVSYKSALFLLHRIRHAMGNGGTFAPLGGPGKDVEADETYVGGKPRFRSKENRQGGGTWKTPVHVLVERGGDLRYHHVGRLTHRDLGRSIRSCVDLRSRLNTDEYRGYFWIGKEFAGGHRTTAHGMHEYARPDGSHSNTAESAFSLFKRGLYGTFHSISPLRIPLYLNEFEFRWNTRWLDDGARLMAAIVGAEGKRLFYRRPKAEREAG